MAVSASDFDASPVRIYVTLHAVWVFFVKTRPAAAGIEFRLRGIERVVAAPTDKRAGREKLVVLAGEGHFRSLIDDDSLFLG